MATTVDPGLVHETDMARETPRQMRLYRLQSRLGLAIVVLAIICGLVTFTILTGLTPVSPSPNVVIGLLVVNLALVAGLIGIIAWRVAGLFIARRRNMAGARLHVRLVSLFSMVALLPALLVSLFASVTLDRGLDAWFSKRTRTIVDNALNVAQAYVQEHGQIIRVDSTGMAREVDQIKHIYDTDQQRFSRILAAQGTIRNLAAVYLLDGDGNTLIRLTAANEPPTEAPSKDAFERAKAGEVAVMQPGETNRVRALVKLKNYPDHYLFIYRYVDPRVLDHLRTAVAGRAEYDSLETRRYGVQITFALMFIGVTLVFLLAAVWSALWVADRLVRPITRLVDAARQVSEGVLNVKVPVRSNEGDLATLGRTFNQMTDQLSSQRDELVNANYQLDERRRFTEAVLSGVTAGVIGLDAKFKITLVNRSAQAFLGTTEEETLSKPLDTVMPEVVGVLERAVKKNSGNAEGHVTVSREGAERTLTVRVTTERSDAKGHGYVVTFDDITELVTAQRNTAWSDIARRIAHEIKNPLTPIQLSAERLKRKYGGEISKDRDIFEQCTETIIRQVGDLRRMVDEFSSFARMPKAVLEIEDVGETVKQAVLLQEVGRGEIEFDVKLPRKPLVTVHDRRQITQAVTNLVQNATEAIEARKEADDTHKGKITVRVQRSGDLARIDVIDNGVGLPGESRQKLVEPYMTTRAKGTGLGLAIVKRILDEHDGRMSLHDAPGLRGKQTGAMVRLEIPLRSTAPSGEKQSETKSKSSAGQVPEDVSA